MKEISRMTGTLAPRRLIVRCAAVLLTALLAPETPPGCMGCGSRPSTSAP